MSSDQPQQKFYAQQRISQVLVVKHFNEQHLGEQLTGGISQQDFVSLYAKPLVDELEIENINYTEAEDFPLGDDLRIEVPEFTLVLILSIGWAQRVVGGNCTETFYAQPNSRELAEELMTAIGDWGHCWHYGHKTVKPKKIDGANSLFTRKETKAVAIEPFIANAPGVDAYLRRMRELGEVVGKAVAEHLKTRGQAITHTPVSMGPG